MKIPSMRNSRRTLYAVLLSGVLTVVCVLTWFPNGKSGDSIPVQIADRSPGESNSSRVELGSGGKIQMTGAALEGMTTAGRMLGETTDDTGMTPASPSPAIQARIGVKRISNLSREELMTEADRIMFDLSRDGILTEPIDYACAFAETLSGTGTGRIILERFRSMHRKHDALMACALQPGNQDSLMTRGWSEIRIDLAEIQQLAAELRNETAVAAR